MEKICPKCKNKHIEEMMYGLMYFEACEAFGKDDGFYGGCYENENTRPDYICLDCGYKWK